MATNIFNMTDTWNNGGTVFTSIKMALTQTASAAGSKLMNLLRNDVSQFAVDPTNGVTVGTPTGDAMGPGRVNVSGGYFINGVPIVGQVTGTGNFPVFNDNVLGLIVRPIVSTDLPASMFTSIGGVKAKAKITGEVFVGLDESGAFESQPMVTASNGQMREKLTASRTFFVRTAPTDVSISIASPGVVTWNAHGLVANQEVYFSILRMQTIVTMTIASPAVVTWTAHGFAAGQPIKFANAGTAGQPNGLPTGVTAGTTYYVIATGLTANTFQFSTTVGGGAVNTSNTQAGVHYGEKAGTMPGNITEGTPYFVVGSSVTTNTFQVSATPGGGAINTTGSTEGQISGSAGSDSNNGLAATAGGAFASIQKAIDIASGLDLGAVSNPVTINVAAGSYSGTMTCKSYVGSGPIQLTGAGKDRTTVTGVNSALAANSVVGRYVFDGFRLVATGVNQNLVNVARGSQLDLRNIDFGPVNGSAIQLSCTSQSSVIAGVGYMISAGAQSHLSCTTNATIVAGGLPIPILGNPTFGVAFYDASRSGVLAVNANTYTGVAQGVSATVATNAAIDTVSGGNVAAANYIPGAHTFSELSGGILT